MGVESIELDTVNLRMVARTLPGKQFEVGRRIRQLVVRALRRAGIVSPTDGTPRWWRPSCTRPPRAARGRDAGTAGAEEVTVWLQGQARAACGSRRSCSSSRSWRCSGSIDNFEPACAERGADDGRSSRPASCPTRTTRGCRGPTSGGPRNPRPPPRPRPARRSDHGTSPDGDHPARRRRSTTVVPGPLGPQTVTQSPTLTPTTPSAPGSGPAPTTPAAPS